ncbi:MAG: hypothetical protein ACOYU6_01875 [Bacteroidota bacterium]|uniref:hypothetical protein n=1 Tax=Hydrotalea lipotrueae TaxID=2803817 RepID=UPI00374280A9
MTFDETSMIISIDGKQLKISLEKISPKLKSANNLQRNFYQVSPSGYGTHWPLIDLMRIYQLHQFLKHTETNCILLCCNLFICSNKF